MSEITAATPITGEITASAQLEADMVVPREIGMTFTDTGRGNIEMKSTITITADGGNVEISEVR